MLSLFHCQYLTDVVWCCHCKYLTDVVLSDVVSVSSSISYDVVSVSSSISYWCCLFHCQSYGCCLCFTVILSAAPAVHRLHQPRVPAEARHSPQPALPIPSRHVQRHGEVCHGRPAQTVWQGGRLCGEAWGDWEVIYWIKLNYNLIELWFVCVCVCMCVCCVCVFFFGGVSFLKLCFCSDHLQLYVIYLVFVLRQWICKNRISWISWLVYQRW